MQRRSFLRLARTSVASATVGVPLSACGAESHERRSTHPVPKFTAGVVWGWRDPAGVLLAPERELLERRQEELRLLVGGGSRSPTGGAIILA
jgi:hypothetical protein